MKPAPDGLTWPKVHYIGRIGDNWGENRSRRGCRARVWAAGSVVLLTLVCVSAIAAPSVAARLDSAAYLVTPKSPLMHAADHVRGLRLNITAGTYAKTFPALVHARVDLLVPVLASLLAVGVALVQHWSTRWLIIQGTTSGA